MQNQGYCVIHITRAQLGPSLRRAV